ncbi:MAG TPA: NAD(P)-binding domain-containing protein [Chitinophagaceae bacterium]|nr:NAD(P)-binding domain-containing protein [Chitinophagaceae bacterium]HMZ45852.1 NAD(P)-binding domain-containing protein [Chitinophagaceae bacterium]HNE93689.1 NAD(P)-binding domain-containing protein [Chitinophagaceae bacterium]HNF28872.1 NAD(P)-binding domain-containing protein [Chitinophagaceae bacterium]HNJ58698.1 NAD(P)-binding domain-containing protein [Chitinophagaceae bacterium]
MKFGVIGSGSWATALAKILTDNGNHINWWIRNTDTISYLHTRKHNPRYVSSAYFNTQQLYMSNEITEVVEKSNVLVIATPSAFTEDVLKQLPSNAFEGKIIISAIKGILPSENDLLNEYLKKHFNVPIENYCTILGPCHAEEVASEKLSYLTISNINESLALSIAKHFNTEYLNTRVNHDISGVQYAAILKNIYALGAGIAHGLEYGDNFLSVYIANAADEMVAFLKQLVWNKETEEEQRKINYAASVYLGDLLVTCYSLYSRNRTFGNMIGKGYSVKAAQLELNMIAEGYNASKCIFKTNQTVNANIPIATIMYKILWEQLPAEIGFKEIEKLLI